MMATLRQAGLTPGVLGRLERAALPPAVVVGADVNGLSVARGLASRGVPVLAIDRARRRYTGYSGAFDLLVEPAFKDPSFVGFLEELAAALPRRAALFLTMDEHVTLLGARGQHLRERYLFELPAPDAVELLMNKERFTRHAQECGWPVPATVFCRCADELRAQLDALVFPVILKPRVKNSAFRTGSPKKAFRCDTPGELLARYAFVARWEAEVVVQQWIPGGDGEVFFSFHYLDRALREVAGFEGRKIRQYPPECGNTASAVGVAECRVTELSRTILAGTGCVGFGSVEYKRDPRTDRFYITEPTVGRTNLQVGVAIANGANTVARAYFHLIGQPYPGREARTWDRKWVMLGADLRSAAHYVGRGELSWSGWAASLRGRRRWAVWSARDWRMLRGPVLDWTRRPFRLLARVARRSGLPVLRSSTPGPA